ncbi:hypothetical protein [Nocardia puris]|uniref:hypothetical protein n=1 Tax=Nocardia puris TaxID=208602 RepID=UPI000AEBE2CC|nr:hypothetical protein [Nocardia puris]
MPTDEITPDTYRWALRKVADLLADPLNKGPKAAWWSTTQKILRDHNSEQGATCDACAQPWPCAVVEGAVKDLRSGSTGW